MPRALLRKPLSLVLFAGLLLVVLAAWWVVRGRFGDSGALPSSPIQVFLIAPSDQHEMESGEYLQVRARVIATEPVQETRLFIDGAPLGPASGSPERAWWIWRAWQPGIHTMYALATGASGTTGQSPTRIINVIAGHDSIEVLAEGGQSLQDIGIPFGIAPVAMAAANPRLDPNPGLPLGEGERVQVPVPPLAGGATLPPVDLSGDATLSAIDWHLKFSEPIERAYCYASDGGGDWYRLPRNPSIYFEGVESRYMQLLRASENANLQVDCWGWISGQLESLGDAAASFTASQTGAEVVLQGRAFDFTGTLLMPDALPADSARVARVQPPYSLRQPLDARDCAAHGLELDRCESLWENARPGDLVLEWEWRIPFWQAVAIDGFRLYSVDPATGQASHLQTVPNARQRVAVVPSLAEAKCFGVRAFVAGPAFAESAMTRYCPGQPAAQQIVAAPADWVTTGQFSETWYDDLGPQEGAVIVAASNYGNEARSSAAVKFDFPDFPADAVLHRASLQFSVLQHQRGGEAPASETFCAGTLGVGLRSWTGLSGGENRYVSGVNVLASSDASAPVASLPEFAPPAVEIDVTDVVQDWLAEPAHNHGFVLVPRPAPSVDDDGGFCYSMEGDFQLVLEYVSP